MCFHTVVIETREGKIARSGKGMSGEEYEKKLAKTDQAGTYLCQRDNRQINTQDPGSLFGKGSRSCVP
jgi:hypothetical protein